jgi:hypothetical protein
MSPTPETPDRDPALFRMGDRLTVILGFAELLLEGSYGPLNEEQTRVLELLIADCREAGDLFHDMVKRGLGRITAPRPKRPGG